MKATTLLALGCELRASSFELGTWVYNPYSIVQPFKDFYRFKLEACSSLITIGKL